MREVEDCLSAQHAELDSVLSALTPDQWAVRTPDCPDWTVADVVLHLAQSDEIAISSIGGHYPGWTAAGGATDFATVDDAVAAAVTTERATLTPQDILARWRAATTALRAAVAAADPKAQVTWVAGQFTVRTLTTTRLAEGWIHTNDITTALALPRTHDDRLHHIARLAWRTIPYAYQRAGLGTLPAPVSLHLTAPDGTPWTLGDDGAPNRITAPALDFVLVAARRRTPADLGTLHPTGPDAATVLDIVRTWA